MKIPVLKLLSFLVLTTSLCAGTYDLLSELFSLQAPDTLQYHRSRIDYSVSHQELYRASRNDTLLSRFSLRAQDLKLNFKLGETSLFASWERGLPNMDDLFQSDYTHSEFKSVYHTFDFQMDTKIKRWHIQPGLSLNFSGTADTLFITDYPRSDQAAFNSFFFDLLPESFGDSIHFKHNAYSINAEFLARNKKITFYASYRFNSNSLTESHMNSSSYSSLSGPRESIAKLNNSRIKFKFAYVIDPANYMWTGIDFGHYPLDWHHTIYPGDPIPSEVIQIAGGQNNSYQAQLGYRTTLKNFHIGTSITGGHIVLSDTASTPVLGYFIGFFPISHQADLDLRTSYLLGKFHADHVWTINRSYIKPRLDIIALRSWSDIDFEALLEFGLEDIQVQDQYIHSAYFFAVGCSVSIALNSDLFLDIDLEQLIPYVKTISPEPPPPPPPDGTKLYGGLSVNIGVSMTW